MPLVDERARRSMFETAPEPVELDFGAGVSAVIGAGLLSDQSISTHYQTSEALHGAYTRLRDLGVDVPTPPRLLTDGSADAYLDLLDSHKGDITAFRQTEEGPPDPFLKTGEEIRSDVRDQVAERRALASRAGLGAQLVGGAAVGLSDPINIASLPLGVFAAETLLGRMAIEGAIGLASQGGVEYAAQGARERAGVTPTAGEVAGNVLAGGALGAGFGAVFHGAGLVARRLGLIDGYHAGVREGRIVPNRKTEAAADALQDAVDTVPALGSPAAERAHLEAVQAAVDVHRAEHPVMRASALARLNEAAARVAQIQDTSAGEMLSTISEKFGTDPAANIATAIDALRSLGIRARSAPDVDPEWGGTAAGAAGLYYVNPATGEGHILLNPDSRYWADPAGYSAEANARGYLASPHPGSVLVHEVGHYLYDHVSGANFAFAEDRALLDAVAKEVGEYAAKNVDEFLAETYSGIVGGKAYSATVMDAFAKYAEATPATTFVNTKARATIDAAIAAEQATPTPPVVERAITEPVEAPRMTTIEQEQRDAFNALAAEHDDLDMTIDLDGEELRGHPSEIMARLDAEEAELTGTVDCMTGAEVVP